MMVLPHYNIIEIGINVARKNDECSRCISSFVWWLVDGLVDPFWFVGFWGQGSLMQLLASSLVPSSRTGTFFQTPCSESNL
jgi:hypothetical protein